MNNLKEKIGTRSVQSSSNCKLHYIDSISSLVNNLGELQKAGDVFGQFLKGPTNFITVINKHDEQSLIENFPVVYSNEVPMGYHGGSQFHMLIVNPLTINIYALNLLKNNLINHEQWNNSRFNPVNIKKKNAPLTPEYQTVYCQYPTATLNQGYVTVKDCGINTDVVLAKNVHGKYVRTAKYRFKFK